MPPQSHLALFSMLAMSMAGPVWAQGAAAPPPEIAEKVSLCVSCHGVDGMPSIEKTPIIAGQHQFYITIQLRDFRAGRRASEIMEPIAKDLSNDDVKALSVYFASLPWPDYSEAAPSEAVARAQALEVQGQCTQCHLNGYLGNSDVPRVGHQKQDYLEQTLRDFRDGKRANAPAMKALVDGWSDDDIVAMSRYLAGL